MPRPIHHLACAAVVLLSITCLPTTSAQVSAWGAQGHHVVARIAWALMTPAAREKATVLLGGGMDTFVAAATWADEVRSARPETYNWHFVDIPIAQPRYDAGRDCAASDKGDCVIAEVARARAELVDPASDAALKGEALKYLIHFVGDLHQPLHASDNHDRGGNDVRVTALRGEEGRATNLHAAWDTGLINLSDETEAARAGRLLADIKEHPTSVDLNVVTWAEESYDVALRAVYRYPKFSPTGPPAEPVDLDQAYRAAALTSIDHRLAMAGARLAALLNAVSGGS